MRRKQGTWFHYLKGGSLVILHAGSGMPRHASKGNLQGARQASEYSVTIERFTSADTRDDFAPNSLDLTQLFCFAFLRGLKDLSIHVRLDG